MIYCEFYIVIAPPNPHPPPPLTTKVKMGVSMFHNSDVYQYLIHENKSISKWKLFIIKAKIQFSYTFI